MAQTQPEKLAAFEGLYKTPQGAAPMSLFGIPNDKEQRLDYPVVVPGLLSFLVHFNFTTPVPGLDQFKPADRPPVLIPFATYHLMVGLGMAFIGLSLLGCLLWWRGNLFDQKWLLWVFVFAVIGPFVANHSGWTAAEVGRQPWVVWHLLRTTDGVSKSVTGAEILTSILLFGAIYSLLFAVWIYVLNEKIQHGPDDHLAPPHATTVEGIMDAMAGSTGFKESMTSAKDPDPEPGPGRG